MYIGRNRFDYKDIPLYHVLQSAACYDVVTYRIRFEGVMQDGEQVACMIRHEELSGEFIEVKGRKSKI